MPKFMKDRAIALLDGGIESYLLGLYGLNLPSLRVRKKVETKNGIVKWKCLCDCGNITYVPINHLKSGATKSCGCLAHDLAIDDLTG